jgi:hypothetical protein
MPTFTLEGSTEEQNGSIGPDLDYDDYDVCDDCELVEILCFWTLFIVLSLPKNIILFISRNTSLACAGMGVRK